MTRQAFRVEDRRKLRTNTFEASSIAMGAWSADGGRDCHSVPAAFHGLDLVEQQLEAVKLAPIAGSQLI
jgi:hypothetical protein